jgi:hypothetical protein
VTGRLYVVRATCALCGDAIRLLGRDWHHAFPHPHEAVPEFFGPIEVERNVIAIADLDEVHAGTRARRSPSGSRRVDRERRPR